LPFRSLVVGSQDDPFCSPERTGQLAQDWGADCVFLGALGHINADSGLGDWPEGHQLFTDLWKD
jgi:predicted alpha/beta hydrolase family esterase